MSAGEPAGEELELENPEEVATLCFEDRKCRQHFVKLAEDWFKDMVDKAVVTALTSALEPPSLNFWFLVSTLGGLGVGLGLGVILARWLIYR